MAYTKYSLTPADNNAAPPNGAPEGMLPSAVNDTMRDMMSQIRDVGDGIRGGTYTMTAPVITGGSITGVALSGNTLTNPVITGGSINNTTVGATTRSTGAFTTLTSNGATTFTAGTASTSTTTGTAVITGGLGVSGRINAANFDGIVGANTAAAGNFTTLGATGVATFSAGTVSAPAITTTGDTNTGIFFPAADTIAFTEGGVESMRIDSSGNVGIGNAVASTINAENNAGNLVVGAGNTSDGITVYSGNTSIGSLNFADGTTTTTTYAGYMAYFHATDAMTFGTGATERMRIDSSGNLLVGTTSQFNGTARLSITASAAAQNVLQTRPTTNITYYPGIFENSSGTTVGYIQSTSSATSYVTSSDYRLKENIAPMTGALEKVSSLKPVTYKWKATGESTQGFIAHELQAVVPECVTGEKDAVDAEGNPVYQGIDTSFLVATLTAAIQELKTTVDAQAARIAALESN